MILAILYLLAAATQIITAIQQTRKTKKLNEMINKLAEYQKEDIVIRTDLVEKYSETVEKANEYLEDSKKIIDFVMLR